MNETYLGEFEQLVLLAVLRLNRDAYGLRIREELLQTANRRASLGAIYTTLERLEQKGFINSAFGDATPQRGGRRKKFFIVNGAGATALRQALKATEAMKFGLEPILGD